MTNFIKRISPTVYVYVVVSTLILVGSFLFISSSEFISGEVTKKVHLEVGEERRDYINTEIRENNEVFRGNYEVLEGGAITLHDAPIGESKTVHVPHGSHSSEYYNQPVSSYEYSPFVYAGRSAEFDIMERYLLVIHYRDSSSVVVSVSKEQYDSVRTSDDVLVRSDGVEVTRGGD